MKNLALIIFLCVYSSLYAQNKHVIHAKELFALDTILYLDDLCNHDFGTRGLNFDANSNELLINYYHPKFHGDTIVVYFVDLKSKETLRRSYKLEGVRDLIGESIRIESLTFDDKFIVLYANQMLIYFERNSPFVTRYQKYSFQNGNDFKSIKCLTHHEVMLSRSYDYYKNDSSFDPSKISLINLCSGKVVANQTAHITNLWMSYMGPYNMISGVNNSLVIGQNYSYSCDVYKDHFKVNNHIARSFDHWKPIDSTVLKKLAQISGNNVTPIIQYLQPKFISGNAFCDGYFLRDEKTLLVRYTLGNNHKNSISRLIDIWRYSQHENKFMLSDTTYIVDGRINDYTYNQDSNTLITKTNFYFDFWLNPSLLTKHYTIEFEKDGKVYPIGLKIMDYWYRQMDYVTNRDGVIGVVILKNRF